MRQPRFGGLFTRLVCAVSICFPGAATAATYYISPTGNDTTGNGSIGNPYKTPNKAISVSVAGDTIFARDGTYSFTSTLSINKVGSAGNPFSLLAYPGETPIFDFTGTTGSARGISLSGQYWNIQGLTVQKAKDNGIYISGSNNTLDRLIVRQNGDSGVQISSSGLTNFPSNNLVMNTDSYLNYDPNNHGENADGFAVKFRELGTGNVLRGNRAWGNSDDGYDFWGAASGITVENCWAFDNGINTFGDTSFQGDGNGIKLGHDSGPHILKNMLIWNNVAHGIDVNGNATIDTGVDDDPPYTPISHGVQIYNNTVYNNGGRNFVFDEFVAAFPHILKNNIAFNTLAGSHSNILQSGNTYQTNTWNGIPVDAADFLSLSDAIARGARLPDGSLPISDFLRLVSGSNLIDAGTDVGIAYNGSAPDLGAFETVVVLPTDGDLNDDGFVNSLDIDMLWDVIRPEIGASDDLNSNDDEDLNGDGYVNEDDVDYLLANLLDAGPNRTYGDADLDGGVGGLDYTAWRERAGSGWANGDFDGDGGVGGLDYTLWRTRSTEYPTTVGPHPGSGSGPSIVPEPGAWLLMALGLPGLLLAARRRQV